MRNEFEPRGYGAELPENSNGLTPEALGQRLRSIRKHTTLEAVAGGASVLISTYVAILGANVVLNHMIVNSKENIIDNALAGGTGAGIATGFALLATGILLPGAKALEVAERNIREKRELIRTAVEKGYDIRGRFFKKIRPTPVV